MRSIPVLGLPRRSPQRRDQLLLLLEHSHLLHLLRRQRAWLRRRQQWRVASRATMLRSTIEEALKQQIRLGGYRRSRQRLRRNAGSRPGSRPPASSRAVEAAR